jgi:hypothetical protein
VVLASGGVVGGEREHTGMQEERGVMEAARLTRVSPRFLARYASLCPPNAHVLQSTCTNREAITTAG